MSIFFLKYEYSETNCKQFNVLLALSRFDWKKEKKKGTVKTKQKKKKLKFMWVVTKIEIVKSAKSSHWIDSLGNKIIYVNCIDYHIL